MADWTKVGRKSRNKGATYERRIAHILSEWWTHGESKRAFRRTVMSGGWDKRFAAGDLLAPVPDFPVHIEIRKREEFALGSLLKGGVIWTWWREGIETADGKSLWYVMSKNGEVDYLVMGYRDWMTIQRALEPFARSRVPYLIVHAYNTRLVATLLKPLLDVFTPDDFTREFINGKEKT